MRGVRGTVAEHGTNARYVAGCRCERCREAHAEHLRFYRYDRELDRPRQVPLDAARAVVAAHRRRGLRLKDVAAGAGMAEGTLLMLLSGRRNRSGKVYRTTFERLRDLPEGPPMVPCARIVPFARALAAIGYSFRDQAVRLGYGRVDPPWSGRRVRVTRAEYVAFMALYRELRYVAAPETPISLRERRAAARRGWLPPLELEERAAARRSAA